MAADPPVIPRKRAAKRVTRITLMIVVPLVVAVVALRIYVSGGRYVVTRFAVSPSHPKVDFPATSKNTTFAR